MKPLANPADQKKAIGLGVAVVVVFGLVIKNVMGAAAGGPPGPAPVVSMSGSSAPAEGGAAAPPPAPIGGPAPPAPAKPADDLIDPPKFALADTPSPFHKSIVGYSGPIASAPIDTGPAPNEPIRGPRRGSGMTGAILPPPGGKSDPIEIKPDVEPLQIMGVITGANPVAVVRVGAQQYVVEKGNKFGRDLRLKEVSDTQVVIQQGSELHILRVGARPPANPNNAPPPTVKPNGLS